MAWEKFEYAEQDTTLPALIIVFDELAEFLDNKPRNMMKLVDRVQDNMQSIARLGRSAHVHMVAATQSCTSNLFPTSLKNNIGWRCICGRVEANISRIAIDSEEGESISLAPGSYLGYSKGETQPYQGYYIKDTKDVLTYGTLREGCSIEDYEDDEEEIVLVPYSEDEDNLDDISFDSEDEDDKDTKDELPPELVSLFTDLHPLDDEEEDDEDDDFDLEIDEVSSSLTSEFDNKDDSPNIPSLNINMNANKKEKKTTPINMTLGGSGISINKSTKKQIKIQDSKTIPPNSSTKKKRVGSVRIV